MARHYDLGAATQDQSVTLRAAESGSGDAFSSLYVKNATVSNIGPSGLQDANRIGILMQNIDNGELTSNTVSDVGVGIETGTGGANQMYDGNDATQGRNNSGILKNMVSDATTYGYAVINGDASAGLDSLLTPSAPFTGFSANFGDWTDMPGNTAVAIYINHSQPLITGGNFRGAQVGLEVQNTSTNDANGKNVVPSITGTTLYGPGKGVSGSVGVLVENSVAQPNSATLQLSSVTNIVNFQTGIKVDQTTAPADGKNNVVLVDRPDLTDDKDLQSDGSDLSDAPTGNTTAVNAGSGGVIQGNFNSATNGHNDPVITSGTGTLAPGFSNSGTEEAGTNPSVLIPSDADVFSSGTVTLASGSTFSPQLTGPATTTPVFNFNSSVSFNDGLTILALGNGSQFLPDANNDITTPYAGLSMVNTQTGNGQLHMTGFSLSAMFSTNVSVDPNHMGPNNTPLYLLSPIDMSKDNTVQLLIRKGAGNQEPGFLFVLLDAQGDLSLYNTPTSNITTSTSSFSTVSINLLAPSSILKLGKGDGKLDLQHIAGFGVAGDLTLLTGNVLNLDLTLGGINATAVPNSELNVTGGVNLGGAHLSGTAAATLVPTPGEQFTLVNNDGTDAVSGTFAGLAQNAVTTIGNAAYKINYSGGDGNDVVLTQVGPLVDLNGSVVSGVNFSTSCAANCAAVAISDVANATVTDSGTTLTSMTVSLASPQAGDTLTATVAGTSITASFSGGVLSLTGTDTVAHYQQVLRTVLYNNTSDGPGIAELVSVVASDSTATSGAAVATIAEPLSIDLNGATSGTGFTAHWTNSGAVNIEDPTAIIGDAPASGTVNITGVTATIVSPNAGDTLTANTTGTSITASFSGGILSLTGTDTVADYQQVLRSIQYNNTSSPPAGPITVNFVATDSLSQTSNTAAATINTSLSSPATVAGRFLFYNNSKFDKNTAGIAAGTTDDAAIAPDKSALLPGAPTATSANVSSYSKGINGIMVDLTTTSGNHGSITLANILNDFTFKVGNNNTPSTWATATSPISVSVRAGAGTGGSDRVELIWADNAIKETWLEVIVKANSDTGLAQQAGEPTGVGDVFFFGDAAADDFNGETTIAFTNATDDLDARSHAGVATITNIYDYNKDGFVNSTDSLAARVSGSIRFIKVANPPAAPDADPSASPAVTTAAVPSSSTGGDSASSDSGIASALTALATTNVSSGQIPGWISSRLSNINLNTGIAATIIDDLAKAAEGKGLEAKLARTILVDADKVADALHLDDSLLDSVLVDLGLES